MTVIPSDVARKAFPPPNVMLLIYGWELHLPLKNDE